MFQEMNILSKRAVLSSVFRGQLLFYAVRIYLENRACIGDKIGFEK